MFFLLVEEGRKDALADENVWLAVFRKSWCVRTYVHWREAGFVGGLKKSTIRECGVRAFVANRLPPPPAGPISSPSLPELLLATAHKTGPFTGGYVAGLLRSVTP